MTSFTKEIVLITGANSGIGFELARQLIAKGTYHVLLGARASQRGNEALKELQARNLPGSIEFLQLDLQDDDDIANAATSINQKHGKLDVLVNNAAVASATVDRQTFREAFDINATGPYLLTKALISLLQTSENPRIVNVSSGAGSIGRRLYPESPMYKIQAEPYRASKVALNMLATCQHVEYGLNYGGSSKKGVKVFVYDPGFTVSNLGPMNKEEYGARSAEATVLSLMDVIEGKRDAEVGKFIHNTGEYPW